jgi:PAS domain S-box-containing protein
MGDLRKQNEKLQTTIDMLNKKLKKLEHADIERQVVEEAYKMSQQRFRDLFEQSPFATLIYAPDGSLMQSNRAASALWGLSEEQRTALHQHYNILEDKQLEELGVLEYFRKAFKGEQVDVPAVKYTAELDNGKVETRWIQSTVYPVIDGSGKVCEVVLMQEDITDRKLSEQALHESERRFRAIFDQTFQFIGLMTTDGTLIEANRTSLLFAGLKEADVLGKPFWETPWWTHSRQLQVELQEAIKKAAAGNFVRFEAFHPSPNGIRYVDVSIKPVKDETGTVLLLIPEGRDITERKQAEIQLRQLRNLLGSIINSMPSVLVGVDGKGKILQWNKEAEKYTGITEKEAGGRDLHEFLPLLVIEPVQVEQAISEQIPVKHEKIETRKNSETRFVDITVYPLVDSGSKGVVIRIDDITERVRMEEMIIHSEKMITVGKLAAGMAHEINNPLAGVLQNMQVIKKRLEPDHSRNLKTAAELGIDFALIEKYLDQRNIPEMIDSVLEAGKRAAEIVDNMLGFSRKSDLARSTYSLAKLLDQSVSLASKDYDLRKKYDFRKIKIIKEYSDNTPEIPCLKNKIQQVFLNVLKNSAQAMSHAGTKNPRITLRVFSGDGMAHVEIEDNGPGMDETIQKRVFEPFFTTKDVGVGTGLGLSVSYFIVVKDHQGRMSVQSSPGKGTTFKVSLPLGEG